MFVPDAKKCMSTVVGSLVSCVGLVAFWSSLLARRGPSSPTSVSRWFQGTIRYKLHYLLKELLGEESTNLMDTSVVKHTQSSETLEPKICALGAKEDGKLSCRQREMQAGC